MRSSHSRAGELPSIRALAEEVAASPDRWHRIVAHLVQSDEVHRGAYQAELERVVRCLKGGQPIERPPLGFLMAALSLHVLNARGFTDRRAAVDLSLSAIDQPLDDMRLLPAQASVGEIAAGILRTRAAGSPPVISLDDWVFLYIKLGTAWAQSPTGSRSENQERAIECFRAAMRPPREGTYRGGEGVSSSDRSIILNNLGNIFKERIRADWDTNQRAAVRYYEQARAALDDCRTEIGDGAFYARCGDILNNLGNAHRDRPNEQDETSSERLDKAIRLLRQSVQDRAGSPLPQAESWRNLGIALLTANLPQEALGSFRAALQVYDRAEQDSRRAGLPHPAPQWHALTYKLLGTAVIAVDDAFSDQTLATAQQCFAEAARRYEELGNRRELIAVHFNWGLLHMEHAGPDAAYDHLEQAAELVEEELLESETERAKTAWHGLFADVYEALAAACVTRPHRLAPVRDSGGDLPGASGACPGDAANGVEVRSVELHDTQFGEKADRAACWLEQGRAKNLAAWASLRRDLKRNPAERLASGEADLPSTSAGLSVLTRLRDVDHRLDVAEQRAFHGDKSAGVAAAQLRKERQDLLRKWRRRPQASSLRGMTAREQGQIAARARRALLTLKATRWGVCASLILPNGQTVACCLSSFSADLFSELLRRWKTAYQQIRALRGMDFVQRVFVEADRRRTWEVDLDAVLSELGRHLGQPLAAWMSRYYPADESTTAARPLTVFAGPGLSMFPLHACYWGKPRQWLGDSYEINYAPSCRILDLCLRQQERCPLPFDRLLAIRNPFAEGSRQSLPMFDVLVDQVTPGFREHLVLGAAGAPDYESATFRRLTGFADRAAGRSPGAGELEQWETVLFATHGVYDPQDPWEGSGIHIAADPRAEGASKLQLADVCQLDLSRLQLVVLAACETAISNATDLTGEQLGLPAGLLGAGAATAIGSLWEVRSDATAFLIARFFHELARMRGEIAGSPSRALWLAQRWLRSITADDAQRLFQGMAPHLPAPDFCERYPYSHPYYWAGFACYGAP